MKTHYVLFYTSRAIAEKEACPKSRATDENKSFNADSYWSWVDLEAKKRFTDPKNTLAFRIEGLDIDGRIGDVIFYHYSHGRAFDIGVNPNNAITRVFKSTSFGEWELVTE